ncbi:DivIVA domain-containing protein [Hoyosella sp. YIM 151337]|uniref:DivIVA domain-containing protein n=1 Tax=Hoyosella sp. YIM 151337 TaxID=2992742 RepID=UPI0022363091|nr:DivIVA domain-containing protein [Hoyosella sp. YIM 151337]MCW4355434.1 DivIVA domain-containing protein [Hoyosella sp. YIM 151337]
MRLTPADVHNVAFKKPSLGKRGYDEDEVDVFLDLVEQELARLVDENNDLRERVSELESKLERVSKGEGSGEAASAQAAKIIGLAQEMADRLTTDARKEADSTLSDAKEKSKSTLTEARDKSAAMVKDAREKADAIVTAAREKGDGEYAAARERAETLKSDAERQHAEILGAINEQRIVLEGRIDQLRTFEREYRVRMKAYLEAQLEDLTAMASGSAPANRPAHQDEEPGLVDEESDQPLQGELIGNSA